MFLFTETCEAGRNIKDCGITPSKLCGDGVGAFNEICNSEQAGTLLDAYVQLLCDGHRKGLRLKNKDSQTAVLRRLASIPHIIDFIDSEVPVERHEPDTLDRLLKWAGTEDSDMIDTDDIAENQLAKLHIVKVI